MHLPIDSALPELVSLLDQQRATVLIAPPGSGKTTRVPPALLRSSWLHGRIIMLQPRRVAARAAARRIAEEQTWELGGAIGYQVRFERCAGPDTRIEVVTEGILTRRLQADPFLEGVGAVILDEFHERSLHSDLGLALLREVQQTVRDDLRLVVMSATLDAGPIAAYLGDCPVLRIEAEPHPLEISYRAPALRKQPLAATVAATIRRALREDPRQGDVLAFLPGVGEIQRTTQELDGLDEVEIVPLHGSLPSDAQDRALRSSPRRRVVLTTNVAETSVTVEGVSCVVDSGLARLPRFDARSGLDQIELLPISIASADQRAGRAGRAGPGRVYRLWTAAEHASLPRQTPAEVRRVDLTATVLELRAWGSDPTRLAWLEPPEAGAIAAAQQLLCRLGALDDENLQLTELGRLMLGLPVHPRLARLLIAAEQRGCLREGAAIAALLSERDILRGAAKHRAGPVANAYVETRSSDVLARLELLEAVERGGHGIGTFSDEINLEAARHALRVRDELIEIVARRKQRKSGKRSSSADEPTLLELLLCAYPDRVARRRQANSPRAVMVGGRGIVLGTTSGVHDDPLFIAVVVDGSSTEARVPVASAIERSWLELREETVVAFDREQQRVIARHQFLYQDLVLDEHPVAPPPEQAAALLEREAAADPWQALQPNTEVVSWLTRVHWLARQMPELGLPALDDEVLRAMLPALCAAKTSFAELRREDLEPWLNGTLDHDQQRALEHHAPARLRVPSGRSVALAYSADDAPVLAVALQELFGSAETPKLAGGRARVRLHLLAPNRRPVQITDDLASFWSRTYPQLRPELSRRYPRHSWPTDPCTAKATARPLPRKR